MVSRAVASSHRRYIKNEKKKKRHKIQDTTTTTQVHCTSRVCGMPGKHQNRDTHQGRSVSAVNAKQCNRRLGRSSGGSGVSSYASTGDNCPGEEGGAGGKHAVEAESGERRTNWIGWDGAMET